MAKVDEAPRKIIPKDRRLGTRKIQALLNRPRTKIVYGTEKTLWTDEDRLNAVNQFVIIGSMQKVADSTGIPVNTLRDWRKFAPWWKDLESILREEANTTRASEITDLTDRVLNSIHDRITDGDYSYNPRTGEMVRIPVSAASLNKIASTMMDKKLVLTKQPTSYTQSTDSKVELDNKLSQLAEAFKSFAGKNALKQPEIVEGELVQQQ